MIQISKGGVPKTSPTDGKRTVEQFFQFFELSGLLFDHGRKEIYNVADIPANNKYQKAARKKARELKIGWDEMSHEDSNRVMLAMLEDSYNLIKEIEQSKNVVLKAAVEVVRK